MNLIEVQADLQNLIKTRISLSQLGEVLGVSRAAMSKRAKLGNDLKPEELKIIGDHYNVNLLSTAQLLKDKKNNLVYEIYDNIQTVELDYYPDLDYSCGNGLIPFGYTKEKRKVPVSLIKGYSEHKRYVVVNAKSDSMMPEIKPNDLLIIRVIDTEPIIDNHIYVFCHDEHLYCKYLSYNIGQVIVRSANKDYPTRYIEGEKLDTFKLHGEVCGHFRSYIG